MRRTWQTNADEFAALDEGEGWPFARLVACSVERQPNGGFRGNQHSGGASFQSKTGKVTAQAFAGRAKTSPARVLRYLQAWEKAAEKGWVPEAATLTPDSVTGMTDPEHNWREVYDARKAGGRPRDSRPDDAVTIVQRRGAEAVVAAMPDEVKAEIARELGKTDVGMDAALEGYAQRPEEKARRLHHKERRAAADDGVTYQFTTGTAMAQYLSLSAVIEEVTTEGDGRDFVLNDEAAQAALIVATAIRELADRLEAWAKGDKRDAWDRGLERLMEGQEGAA